MNTIGILAISIRRIAFAVAFSAIFTAIEALSDPANYEISANPPDGGTVIPVSGFNEVMTPFQISATANSGYCFVNWTWSTNPAPLIEDPNSSTTTLMLYIPYTDTSVTANFATNRYVSQSTGSDTTGTGTQANPWASIYCAIDNSNENDTIHIVDAVHTEEGIYVDKKLVFSGNGADETILQANAVRGAATKRVFFGATDVSFTVRDMTVRHGNITLSNVYGGGITAGGSTAVLTVERCSIEDNNACFPDPNYFCNGGGISVLDGTLIMKDSTVSGNLADGFGGGIHLRSNVSLTNSQIVNCTIADNEAANTDASGASCGGGIHFYSTNGSTLSLHNCTISANTCSDGISARGGGICKDSGSFVFLVNSIVAGNSVAPGDGPRQGPDCFVFSSPPIIDNYSLIGDGAYSGATAGTPNANNSYVGTSLAPVVPGLSSLSNNGGPTNTMKLNSGSVAIDHGRNDYPIDIPIVSFPSYDQRGAAFLRTFGVATDIGAFEFQPKKIWDLNADNRSDLVADDYISKYGYLYLMNGSSPSASNNIYRNTNPDWSVAGLADFNGDFRADLIWESASTGKSIIYLMEAFTITTVGTIYNGGTGWKLDKLGDFNGDGKMDILWKHPESGQGAIYIMDGTVVSSSSSIARKIDWIAKDTGDFNGDGKADILWEIANKTGLLYLMDGENISSQGDIYVRSGNWTAKYFADFNGDKKQDILWEHTDGTGCIYLMNGLTISSTGIAYRKSSANWNVTQIGDLNGDGKADLFWQDLVSGVGAGYLMNGTSPSSTGIIYTLSNPDWQVKKLLDFNGDGKADILWQNSSTKKAIDYIMNGLTISATGTVFGSGTKNIVLPPLSSP